MTFLRNVIALLAITFFTLGLSACDNQNVEKKSFTNTINGIELTFIYYYDGDVVQRQEAVNILPYQSIGVENTEQARAKLSVFTKAYQGVDGVTDVIDYKEDHAEEHLSVDFSKAKISELCKLPGSAFSDCRQTFISMKKSEEILAAQGFKEVK